METLLIVSCNGKNVQASSTIEQFYQADLNIDKLKPQLAMCIKHVVTKVSTVCDISLSRY